MALLFIDGFDHYTTAQIPDKNYVEVYGAGINTSYARFNGQGLAFGTFGKIKKDIKVNKSTLYIGFAFKKFKDGVPGYDVDSPFISFKDESSVVQVRIHILSDYSLSVYNGAGTLLDTSSAGVFYDKKWQYIEAKAIISDTIGEVEVKINGSQVLNLTSQDTKNGTDYIRHVEIRGVYYDLHGYVDDMYVDDAQFHGDCRVRAFMPDLDGNSADFTRSAGANDYECVDETISNEDTDYISSDTLNHKSIFGITTGALGTVKGVQVNNHCRLDEAGTRKIKPIVRSNITDYQGAETDLITADYIFESEIWELDPDDSAAWTQTKLEAAEFGLEITT